MTTTITQFPIPPGLAADVLRRGFAEVAPAFREPPGLLRKYFLLSPGGGTAGGVYLWKSESDARAFEATLRSMIRDRFGVEPAITTFETPVVVDNLTAEISVSEEASR
jgi:hypothetical protein